MGGLRRRPPQGDDEDPGTPTSATRSPIPGCARATRASIRRAPGRAVGRRARAASRDCGTTTRSQSPPADRAVHGARPRSSADHLTRRLRRRRHAAEHPRRHAPAQPRRRRHELRRGRAVERGRRGDERRRHRARRRSRRAGLRRRALHRARPALDVRRRAGDRSRHGRAARDHRPDRRHASVVNPLSLVGRRRDRARGRGAPARRAARARRPPARALRRTCSVRRRPAPRSSPARAASCSTRPSAGRAARSRRSPPAAALLVLPSGLEAVAEPARGRRRLSSCARQRAARRGRRGPCWSCASSATSRPRSCSTAARSSCARATSRCSRSSPCTAGRSTPTSMCAELYGDDGHPASIRVEMSRLRRLLPGAHRSPTRYGLVVRRGQRSSPRARAARPRRDRRRGGRVPRSAAAVLRRPGHQRRARGARGLDAPGGHHVRRRRRPLVVGAHGLRRRRPLAWQRLLAAIDYTDPRRSLAAARTARSGARPCSGHVTPRVMH